MARRILIWLTLIVLGGLLLPLTGVTAASEQPDDGVVIWNEDYTLREEREVNGDLVVFNGDATLEANTRVTGDVVIWNGNADVNGIVEGTLVVSTGQIRLSDGARVQGDVVCSWNCDIERAEGARIDGDIIEGPALRWLPLAEWASPGLSIRIPAPGEEPPWVLGARQLLRWILRVLRTMVTTLVIAAIGGIVALIWPEATTQVERTVFESPGASLGVGLLTVIASVAMIIALAITICLSPLAALVALALGAAGLFGWIAIGARVGRRLLAALDAGDVAPLWTTALGTLLITLITLGLTAAFCLAPLGWLLIVAIGSFGLGSVVLTRFGTTPYTPDAHPKGIAPVSPPAPAEEMSPEPAPEDENDETIDQQD